MSITTVQDVITAFASALKNVDIRAVAVKPTDTWVNVITSLFFSYKQEGKIKAEQQRIRERLVNTEKFRILLTCLPAKNIQRIFNQIMKGKARIHRTDVSFRQFNPYELSCCWTYPNFLKRSGNQKFIGAESIGLTARAPQWVLW